MSEPLSIDKATTALVVIDLQKGIASMPTAPTDSNTVVANSAKLAEVFRENGMPVVLVRVAPVGAERLNPPADEVWKGEMPPDWSELVAQMKQTASDILITKKQWGHFTALIWNCSGGAGG